MESIAESLSISDTARQKFSAAVDKQNLIAQTGTFIFLSFSQLPNTGKVSMSLKTQEY